MKKSRPKSWPAMAKGKGRDAENAVCDFLRLKGIPAERRRLTGTDDMGDIAMDGATIEVKACKAMDLSGWLAEAETEGDNADKHFNGGGWRPRLVVAKKRGTRNPAQWYAVMTFEQAVRLIEAAKRLQ